MQGKKIAYNTKGRKRLQDWLSGNNISMYRMAKIVDVNYATLWRWVAGDNRPTYESALTLQSATYGEVPIESWSEFLSTMTKEVKKPAKKRKARSYDK